MSDSTPNPQDNSAAAADFQVPETGDTVAAILSDTCAYISRFMVLTTDDKVVIALWIFHTYVFDAFEQSPYLVIRAPEKQSGKTRLLEVIEPLVNRPWMITRPSEAVLYRKIDDMTPTLLLDETDAIFKAKNDEKAEALRAILDAGNRAGVSVSRCTGGNHSVVDFSVYCPKALAGIGAPPDTIADRSWSIFLKRKKKSEITERYRRRLDTVMDPALELHHRMEAWAKDEANVETLRGSWPELPEDLSDRAQDNAEALLAIADLASKEWGDLAREAIVNTYVRQADTDEGNSLALQALIDCRTVFNEHGSDWIETQVLADRMQELDGPWGEGDRKLTPHKLAWYLQQYEITAKQKKIDGTNARRYHRADFEDAWERWASKPLPGTEQQTVTESEDPAAAFAETVG